MMKRSLALGLVGLLALGACKTNDDVVQVKDRELGERDAEIAALRKRLADEESVRGVMQKDLDQSQQSAEAARAERERLAAERARLNAELAAARTRPVTPEVRPVADRSSPSGTDGLEVDRDRKGDLVLRLDSAVTFGAGSATLSDAGKKLLRENVASILAQHGGSQISVEGHTDDQPIQKSRWQTNLNLSIARALEVRQFLVSQLSMQEDRIRVVGYGETRPRVEGSSKEARAKNRRVEIIVETPADN